MAFKMKGFDPGEGTGLNAKRKLLRKRIEATNTISKSLGKTNTLPKKIDYEFNPTMKSNKNEGVNKVNYKPTIKPQKTKKGALKLKTDKKIDGKRVNKTDSGRIEGEILGIYDNEYNEAKQDKDLKRIKQLEKRMLKLRNTVVKRGDGELFTKNKSHIDMSKFGKSPMKKHHDKKRGYDTQGADAKEELKKQHINLENKHLRNEALNKKDNNKRRLKEVKSSIRDLRKERIKKIGNKKAQANLKSAIAGLKDKKKELKGKNKKKVYLGGFNPNIKK